MDFFLFTSLLDSLTSLGDAVYITYNIVSNGGRVRGRPRFGWIDGVKVVLGYR